MNLPRSVSLLAFASAALSAHAGTISYSLRDLFVSNGAYGPAAGLSYSGTGFVGQYARNLAGFDAFGHLFGLVPRESTTNAQVNLSALAGRTIASATLSYILKTNQDQGSIVTVTGYASSGSLSYLSAAPTANLGTATGTALAASSIDVTALVASALAAQSGYLGLYLEGSRGYNLTYTDDGSGFNPDAAQVRLTVTYADVPPAVPGPMAALPFALMALKRRKRA